MGLQRRGANLMDLTLSWDVWLLALEQALEQGELPDLPVKVVWHTGEVRVIEEAAIRYGPGGSIEGVELIKWSTLVPESEEVQK